MIKELMSGLLGKEEQLVSVLNDFHASSVLLLKRDCWRVASRLDLWSCETEFEVRCSWEFRLIASCSRAGLLSAKIEGWRNE